MTKAILSCKAPDGSELQLAEGIEHEEQKFFRVTELEQMRTFYETNGYVVVRNLIPSDLCSAARSAFSREVKPYQGLLYRQPSSGAAEKHKFSPTGYMLNSILNVQDLDPSKFSQFRKDSLAVLTHDQMYEVVKSMLQEHVF